MKQPIETYFQVGVVAAMAYPDDYPARADEVCARIARDDFFQAIELNPIAQPDVRARATHILRAAHMTVLYGAQARLLGPGLNPNALDEGARQRAEETLLDALEEARELGAPGIAFLAGAWEDAAREQALAQLLKTTRAVCARAAQYGMGVELEVFDFDIAKRALIGPAALAARFAAAARERCPNFGLLVDLSHIPMCRESAADVVRTLRPYITHFHIGNTVCRDEAADAYGDEHPRFGYPASENDTPQVLDFLRVLRAEGFFRPEAPMALSFEVKPRPGEDAQAVLAGSKRVLRRAWAML